MVQLADKDIQTREVLDWSGIHLLHFGGSTASQKIRIALNLKGIDWTSHPVNIVTQKNFSAWFLGINPRGLLPVLVHDGDVHVESNDILNYLEKTFPEPALIPNHLHNEIQHRLKEEQDLQMDLRAISLRFVFPQRLARKRSTTLNLFQSHEGTIAGEIDPQKALELAFWQDMKREGITDAQSRRATKRFKRVYGSFERQLSLKKYLTGNVLTLLDIVWFIYTHRLTLAGYPFRKLHPNVFLWYHALLANPIFAREVKMPLPVKFVTSLLHTAQCVRGKSFSKITDVVPDQLYQL